MHPAEEVTKPDPDLTNKGAQAAGTMQSRITNIVTSADSKDTGRRNDRKESRRTSPAETPRAKPTGREFTWRRTPILNQSVLLDAQKTDSKMITKNTMKNMDLTQLELNLIDNISQEPQPLPSKIQVFSKELDDSPHPSS
jgi:hypothetical protein